MKPGIRNDILQSTQSDDKFLSRLLDTLACFWCSWEDRMTSIEAKDTSLTILYFLKVCEVTF